MEDKKNVRYNMEYEKRSRKTGFSGKILRSFRDPGARTGLVAAALVLALTAGSIVTDDRAFSERENRTLAQLPAFSLSALKSGAYTEDINEYLADQFPLRDFWIRLRARCETAVGHYCINDVWLGDGGFLFEAPPAADEEALQRRLLALRDFSERAGSIPAFVMIVPNAVSVMRDALPDNAPVADQDAYLDALYRGLAPGLCGIDVRQTFREAYRAGTQLYYRTDHHWTSEGAWTAFQYASEALGFDASSAAFEKYPVSSDFRGTLEAKSGFRTEPDVISVYLPQGEQNVAYLVEDADASGAKASVFCPEKLHTADQYGVFFGGNSSLIHITSTADSGKKLLIFKDSYANCFVPFLIPFYSEIFMVDPRYYEGDVYALIEENRVDQVLFLYNSNTFAEDSSLEEVLQAQEAS